LDNFEAKNKLRSLHFSVKDGPSEKTDHIAYIEGPSAYFMMVLSAQTANAYQQAMPAFLDLFQSFSPMSASIKK
jgi:hypothetical protein